MTTIPISTSARCPFCRTLNSVTKTGGSTSVTCSSCGKRFVVWNPEFIRRTA